jgi:transcriptional regulator with XRE-family HTH domain
LLQRLKRSREARAKFVESHLDKSIAFQIRSLRDKQQWTQEEFAQKLGIKHRNNVSARLENPNYGNHSLRTLKKIAATCDVALVVWFIPFGRWLDWVTGTPYLDNGLSEGFYNIPTFGDEFELANVPLERMSVQPAHRFMDDYGSASEQGQAPLPGDNQARSMGAA